MIQANSLHIPIKDDKVQCVITSPAYWGLRDYGTAIWEGGKNGCDHKRNVAFSEKAMAKSTIGAHSNTGHAQEPYLETCGKCGAKRIDNQLGLEKTPEEYVENTVKWAREVWRVLRKDGTFWLNLGDSYAGSWGAMSHDMNGKAKRSGSNERPPQSFVKSKRVPRKSFRRDGAEVIPGRWGGGNLPATGDLKPKDLCEIPSDVVRALRKDGWWLRSRLPWVKRSAMPESCTDRPASALEYVFLLTKSSKYYFDMESIRKPVTGNAHAGRKDESLSPKYGNNDMGGFNNRTGTWKQSYLPSGRNFRNTDLFYQSLEEPHGAIFCGEEMVGLDVNPQAYKDAHFATFPEKLVEPLIKAGTSEKGACPECGAPWERVVEKTGGTTGKSWHDHTEDLTRGQRDTDRNTANGYESDYRVKTIGWQPTCKHNKETVPCIVLDPFGGSGTTKNVADRLGRRGVICELKMEYIEMAKKRCRQEPGLF